MYRVQVLHHPDYPPRQSFSDSLPICVFYTDGQKLFAFEASWQNLFDFFKTEKRDPFEVVPSPDSWHSANTQSWGKRFHHPVLFSYTRNPYGRISVTLTKERWKNQYDLQPGRSRLISYKGQFIVQQPWCSFKG